MICESKGRDLELKYPLIYVIPKAPVNVAFWQRSSPYRSMSGRRRAAPLFRKGASVPGVGVLLALPCLVESGLFRISRKLYGEIGPAFYGLRTTLLTLLLMALLRIKRPEHLKERDPV